MMWIIILVTVALFFVWLWNPLTFPPFAPHWTEYKRDVPAYTELQAEYYHNILCRGCGGTVKTEGIWDADYDAEEVDMRFYKTRFESQVYGLTDTPKYYFCAKCVEQKKNENIILN